MELQKIRKQIDSLDSDIIALLSKRAELVSAAGKFKEDDQGVRDPKRVEQVIEKVKVKASAAGLDPAIAEEIYRTIIGCFRSKRNEGIRCHESSPQQVTTLKDMHYGQC
jgi:isochorismate pyruvate lyase